MGSKWWRHHAARVSAAGVQRMVGYGPAIHGWTGCIRTVVHTGGLLFAVILAHQQPFHPLPWSLFLLHLPASEWSLVLCLAAATTVELRRAAYHADGQLGVLKNLVDTGSAEYLVSSRSFLYMLDLPLCWSAPPRPTNELASQKRCAQYLQHITCCRLQ